MSSQEKKGSKMKASWHKFKELWANPRSRAAMLLGLYALFILFVVGGVRSGVSTDKKVNKNPERLEEKKETTTTFKQMDNYEYDLKVNQNEEITLFQGKHHGTHDLFINTLNNNAYYVEEKVVYQVIDGMKSPLASPLYNIDITLFSPDFIHQLLDVATLDYTTNYSTGIEKKNYILSLGAFMKMVYGSDVSSNEIITITTSTKDKVMQTVEIDLSGYEKITDPGITKLTLEITYKNIHGVEEFHID